MRRPVFVDHTGRRRRAAIVVGSGLGVFLVLGLIMMAVGMFSGGSIPLPGWPDNAGKAEPAPTPSAVVQPTRSRGPVTVPTPGTTVTPSPTGPGNGNGNGHGKPSRPPGKP